MAIAAVLVASLLSVLQGVTLFVVKDLRERIMRLESMRMTAGD